ncbi:hypothetical protein XELAEV_18007637mg [Xenopus laevis]|uniref:Ig-like domain-containing protein n=1 Tax=Xenopus laevis TaxID=8355 RepID=A0A974E3F9_XENLA|nr:hypothetical protein XELAEV_18007637mg [Xenopus laevis]
MKVLVGGQSCKSEHETTVFSAFLSTMSNILILLLMISFSSCSDSQNVVTQDSAVSVLPGGSVGLSCSWTGGSVTGTNHPNWIHQTPGSIPKLAVGSWGTGNQNYRPSGTPERFTGAITGGKAVLSISRAQAEDDGVYYCALWTGSAPTMIHISAQQRH